MTKRKTKDKIIISKRLYLKICWKANNKGAINRQKTDWLQFYAETEE